MRLAVVSMIGASALTVTFSVRPATPEGQIERHFLPDPEDQPLACLRLKACQFRANGISAGE